MPTQNTIEMLQPKPVEGEHLVLPVLWFVIDKLRSG
jgi:hypothetical protein